MKTGLLAALLAVVLPGSGFAGQSGKDLPPIESAADLRCIHLSMYDDRRLTDIFVGIFVGQLAGNIFGHEVAERFQDKSTLPLELNERSRKAFAGSPIEIKHRVLAKCALDEQLLLKDALVMMYLEKILEK